MALPVSGITLAAAGEAARSRTERCGMPCYHEWLYWDGTACTAAADAEVVLTGFRL
jgi:hypothetical protein